MSPGNSYFKDAEIAFLLKTVVEKFGRVAILIADVPAISTYIALGYPENRARRDKAIPKGNALKNRVRKEMEKLGYSESDVTIVDWELQVAGDARYDKRYREVRNLYESNPSFCDDADSTTRSVLQSSFRKIPDIEAATKIATHYLLSEIAFLEFAPELFGVQKATYVYHRNWPIYEQYIAGKFDQVVRPYLDFLLIENPYETYNLIWGLEDDTTDGVAQSSSALERIEKTGILRVGFANYSPAFMRDRSYENFSGIFYELIVLIARQHDWQLRWTEEVGYGVVLDGLENARFDLFGSTVWPTPDRLGRADFSVSLYRSLVFMWVRAEDGRTREQLLADSRIRVAVKENDIADSIARADFPACRVVRIPQLSDTEELLRAVVEDRADFTFVEPYLAGRFNASSEKTVRALPDDPVRVFDNAFVMRKGESALKDLFDRELEILRQSGIVGQLIEKYTGSENTFNVD